ncbi:MarR family winged helix-turn-helix transcriptional regulator [Rothia amarae]|uniref:MarR family winged helix-turn-helix transcriptional regulator n=1 Tax=Rothia amarae TaxID=169480 RepID=UPI003645A7A2
MNLEERHSHTSALISTVGRRLESHRRTILTKSNLKNAEYAVLVTLAQQGRTQTELATEIGVRRTHVGSIVNELLQKELVAITTPAEVSRNKIYALTPTGYRLQEKLRAGMIVVD